MRGKLLAGNWKMHKTIGEVEAFFEDLGKDLPIAAKNLELMIATPYTALGVAQRLAAPLSIRIAAQNIHWESQGAFTGEVSLGMIKDLGINATLIGHSERRQYFGETDQSVAKKVAAAISSNTTPILCIGETLTERENGDTEAVISRQLKLALSEINKISDLVIAYEPVWAIGTGRTATQAQAQGVHGFIRGLIHECYGKDAANSIKILYGGSVNPSNISSLLSEPDIDGALIGGASLKPLDFLSMIRSVQKNL